MKQIALSQIVPPEVEALICFPSFNQNKASQECVNGKNVP